MLPSLNIFRIFLKRKLCVLDKGWVLKYGHEKIDMYAKSWNVSLSSGYSAMLFQSLLLKFIQYNSIHSIQYILQPNVSCIVHLGFPSQHCHCSPSIVSDIHCFYNVEPASAQIQWAHGQVVWSLTLAELPVLGVWGKKCQSKEYFWAMVNINGNIRNQFCKSLIIQLQIPSISVLCNWCFP